MPFFPTINETKQTNVVSSVFLGYNRHPEVGEGSNNSKPYSNLEFWDTENLTADFFPMMASRAKRGIVRHIKDPGGIIAKDKLAYVDSGKLYYDGTEVDGIQLTSGDKQLVSMGAYLVIFPDKVYVNTKDLTDIGSMEASYSSTGNVSYLLCNMDGRAIEGVTTEKPQNPQGGEYWIDTSTTPHSLKQFSASTSMWVSYASVYTKISCTGIGTAFGKYDGVTISGVEYSGENEYVRDQYKQLNGSHVIQDIGDDYIIIVGMIDEASTQTTGSVSVTRTVPDMDYITESGNRLWGCKYGIVDGKNINEIYCCALGDFKNWNKFQGISTDSYVASVGTDGKWTGAVTHMGYPLFFKEHTMHKVYVSSTGAHQINDTACRGVQEGCSKSLAIVNERLFYKSRGGVMMYDGSLPESVSDALGNDNYYDAVAGSIGDKYYISMKNEQDEWFLFTFDTSRGIWLREDNSRVRGFATLFNEMYFIHADSNDIVAVNGSEGHKETNISWFAETGLIGYTASEHKYVSRFNIRMLLPKGSNADLFIQYDSSEKWEHCGHMEGQRHTAFVVPVRPRRCDHFQFRIEGVGEVKVYSIAKVYEIGSDEQ